MPLNENLDLNSFPHVAKTLAKVLSFMEGDAYFLDATPTLADLHAAPMIALFRQAPEGERLLADHTRWLDWWKTMSRRPSMAATQTSG